MKPTSFRDRFRAENPRMDMSEFAKSRPRARVATLGHLEELVAKAVQNVLDELAQDVEVDAKEVRRLAREEVCALVR